MTETTTKDHATGEEAARVQAGLEQFFQVQAQNTKLKAEVEKMTLDLAVANQDRDRLNIEVQDARDKAERQVEESKMAIELAYHERDRAVADRAVYEALFRSIQVLLHEFVVPEKPLSGVLLKAPAKPKVGVGDLGTKAVEEAVAPRIPLRSAGKG